MCSASLPTQSVLEPFGSLTGFRQVIYMPTIFSANVWFPTRGNTSLIEGLALQVAEDEDDAVPPAAATQPAEDAAASNSTNHIPLPEWQTGRQGTVSDPQASQDMQQQLDVDLLAAVDALLPEWGLTLPGLEDPADLGRFLTA